MRKHFRVLICAVCLIICLGMLAGCGDGAQSSSPTPAPTGAQTAGNTPKTETYLMDRDDENLKNAIKEGETYRYFVWTTNDPANPFELEAEGSRDFLIKRRSEYESKYGITIEYVQTASDWAFSFAAAAYSGAPMADIFNAGGPFNVISHYNYEGNPGSILEPLSQYSEYADFSGWAAGFDSFSVSFNDLNRVKHHIEKQETVHQELSFEDEYDQLLEENGFNAYQDFMRASFSAYAAVNNHIKNKRK